MDQETSENSATLYKNSSSLSNHAKQGGSCSLYLFLKGAKGARWALLRSIFLLSWHLYLLLHVFSWFEEALLLQFRKETKLFLVKSCSFANFQLIYAPNCPSKKVCPPAPYNVSSIAVYTPAIATSLLVIKPDICNRHLLLGICYTPYG